MIEDKSMTTPTARMRAEEIAKHAQAQWPDQLADAIEQAITAAIDAALSAAQSREQELAREIKGLRKECVEVEQALGRALGYPRYCDDQKNFPGSTDADGVCVGEHVPSTIATEAALKLAAAKEDAGVARALHAAALLLVEKMREDAAKVADSGLMCLENLKPATSDLELCMRGFAGTAVKLIAEKIRALPLPSVTETAEAIEGVVEAAERAARILKEIDGDVTRELAVNLSIHTDRYRAVRDEGK